MKKIIAIMLLLLGHVIDAIAQGCSTCTATANNLDRDSAEGLNLGIIYLAFTPLAFLVILGIIWYRKTKGQ